MPFRKQNPAAPDGFFAAEAAGLRWLADAADGARIAGVADVGRTFIELERVPDGRPTATAARTFGAALARTHEAGAAGWGAPPDGYDGPTFIGRQPMTCRVVDAFGAFYAEQRVLPYLRVARDAGHVDGDVVRTVEAACDRLAGGDFDDGTEPARIHGDLWSGNVLWTPEGVCLIDPAAHGGHPETDLAMVALFGTPMLDHILDGYVDAHPLPTGWPDRVPLHQLHPLAVHAASHGSGYAAPLAAAARAVLAL